MSVRLLGLVATLGALLAVPLAGTRSTFVPDWTFKGDTPAGWHVLGAADWKAVEGELVGTPKSADGGWLCQLHQWAGSRIPCQRSSGAA